MKKFVNGELEIFKEENNDPAVSEIIAGLPVFNWCQQATIEDVPLEMKPMQRLE